MAVSQQEVDKQIKSFTTNGSSAVYGKTQQSAATHSTDFDVPIYNVWKQQTKTEGSSHFGNSEVHWLDNLLYLYTEPFERAGLNRTQYPADCFSGGFSCAGRTRFRAPVWVG